MKIGLFATCLVNVINPKIGIASYKLLEAANLSVTVAQNKLQTFIDWAKKILNLITMG